MIYKKEFTGELLGTFILVLFGCGSVATSVLFDANKGLMQIALAWGVGVTLAIYATRHLSCAHLNPAVSCAMVLSGRMNPGKLPAYLVAQFAGAFLAGVAIYGLFAPSISNFEAANEIIRGTPDSVSSAKMFGEYYQGTGAAVVSMPLAMAAETFGTFLLVLMIFILTDGCNTGRPDNSLSPVFIGLTIASIIYLIAPITQAGLNPARDFGPRLVAWAAGWGQAAFPDNKGGFFLVYLLSPVAGGLLASLFFVKVIEPSMKIKSEGCNCNQVIKK